MSKKYVRFERCERCKKLTQTALTRAFGLVCQSCNEHLRRGLRIANLGSHGKVGKYWDDERNALLSRIYHTASVAECQAAFPGKSLNALYQQARLLGIHQEGVKIYRSRGDGECKEPPMRPDVPADRVAPYCVADSDLQALVDTEREWLRRIRKYNYQKEIRMKIERGQRYRNEYGALIKVLEPSLFDENEEEYFVKDVYDKHREKWCGAKLRHYKKDDCLAGLTLVENSDV